MKRQKSFENGMPSLYLVPTPIGNLNEMSPRAIEILQAVDVIACEDTRTSGQMLKHFNIHKRLIAYQNFNEESSAKGILNLLSEGKNIALISDAGYPLMNDPGQRIATKAAEAGYNVIPVSGPNAMLDGLVASGLIAQPFLFIGFLPQSDHDRKKKLQEYADYPMTMVFYEAPHRIARCLETMVEVLGDRKACIARELTKIHEEFLRGTLTELLAVSEELRGEMVIIVEGKPQNDQQLDSDTILQMVEADVAQGMSRSDAIKETAKRTGTAKNKVYEIVHGSHQE